ncbi:uncharacterized protein V1510DRAFT_414767 [Dipodascopsis tothii]|uniref:uncharacterized protein n=1 Tax=Dipodascopsis tothii TaxID=44089 RepID=UPI0034CFC133
MSLPQWSQLTQQDSEFFAIQSQRDLAQNVSIDQLTYPGVNLNTVILDKYNYTADSLALTSQLLDVGFRRVFVDLFWNPNNATLQLCPFVGRPDTVDNGLAGFSGGGSTVYCAENVTINNLLDAIYDWIADTDTNLAAGAAIITLNLRWPRDGQETRVQRRQLAAGLAAEPATAAATTVASHASETRGSAASVLSSGASALSSAAHSVAASHSSIRLSTPSSARLHTTARASLSSVRPSSTAASTTVSAAAQVSFTADLVSDQIRGKLRYWMYTPTELDSDRESRLTWDDSGRDSNGWPLLDKVLYVDDHRLLFTYGVIEIGNDTYPYDQDLDSMFPPSELLFEESRMISTSSSTSHTTGTRLNGVCSLGDNGMYIGDTHLAPSWLLAWDNNDDAFTAASVRDYVACGYSPVLNSTHSDMESFVTSFLQNSIWSWSPGQPPVVASSDQSHQCAVITPDGWTVTSCYSPQQHAACRIDKESYEWTLSASAATFADAKCSAESGHTGSLSLPRTALQNSYLRLALANAGYGAAFVELNSIAGANCWVSGGTDATCPYQRTTRVSVEVIVPTVATIIVSVLLALTMWSKWRDYNHVKARRRRKRRAKIFAENEYKGVPS